MKYDIFGTNVRNDSDSFDKIAAETTIFLTWITVKILQKFPYKFRHEMFIKTSKYQTEFCILKPENEKRCLYWHFLYKNSLNMGPIFYQKILKHGSTFLTEPKFLGFRMAKTPKITIFFKWAYFSRKILKNGYPFLPKSPLKMGRGFEARAAHPCPTQIWVPPRGSYHAEPEMNPGAGGT